MAKPYDIKELILKVVNAGPEPASMDVRLDGIPSIGKVAEITTLTSAQVTLTSVDYSILNVGAARVGYLLFNDHVLPSERPMIDAIGVL